MSHWRIAGKRLGQPDLAAELTVWLGKVASGVRLFREGPTLSEFQWGCADLVTDAELAKVWLVRQFCAEYELFARRLSYDGHEPWQLRIAAQSNHLPGGESLKRAGDGEENALLLGEALGGGAEFEMKPNRYRRARLCYPFGSPDSDWQAGQRVRTGGSALSAVRGQLDLVLAGATPGQEP